MGGRSSSKSFGGPCRVVAPGQHLGLCWVVGQHGVRAYASLPSKRDWRLNGYITHHREQFRGTWTSRSVWLLETSAMILGNFIPELLFEQFLFPFYRELYMPKVRS